MLRLWANRLFAALALVTKRSSFSLNKFRTGLEIRSDKPCRYVDGAIHREGVVGDTSSKDYSTGVGRLRSLRLRTLWSNCTQRGGAGNIASPQLKPQMGKSEAHDVIPEVDVRDGHEKFHTGVSRPKKQGIYRCWLKANALQRGGQGNVHKEKYGGHSHDQSKKSVLDKAKEALHLDGHKKDAAHSTS